jgi:fructose-1,6-bisphosphatase/inositol monophosphatase family enzyme
MKRKDAREMLMLADPDLVLAKLRELGRRVRDVVVRSRERLEEEEWRDDLAAVSHQTSADTIYKLDLLIEPVIEEFCEEWGRQATPLVVVAEGIEPETGRVFPQGAGESDARVRVIMDPVDGTRGLMYDKRAAWSLAGAAPNKGAGTRLSDIEVAVMTELPTSKMSAYDVLWAIRGRGAHGVRERADGRASPLRIAPSRAETIAHGFAMVSNFFPGTKVLASELMEEIVRRLLGEADVGKAMVFDDQYISTGGQFYELIVGHDRFNADLRPLFYRAQGQPEGLCCHPYDCAGLMVAREVGVVVTDALGRELDGPMDVTTGLSWAGFANGAIRAAVEPVMIDFFRRLGIRP